MEMEYITVVVRDVYTLVYGGSSVGADCLVEIQLIVGQTHDLCIGIQLVNQRQRPHCREI